MDEILRRINKQQGVRGSLIVGADGLLIAGEVSGDEDLQTMAAVGSSVAASLATAIVRLGSGDLSRFIMHGSTGSVVLMMVKGAILLTLVRKDANMGMILVELKESARQLAEKVG